MTAEPDPGLRLERLLGIQVHDCRFIGGPFGLRHCRATLADGRAVFAKIAGGRAGDPGFGAEARGLRWLGEAAAAPVPDVIGWGEGALVISRLGTQAPERQAAERFGRDLARLHAVAAQGFGAPWPGVIAGLPLGNEAGNSWPAGV